ncbi:MAG: PilC/PilY family type IV pilus protein [Pseudomonadota bacterium]
MKRLKHKWITSVVFLAFFIFMFHVSFADVTCLIETDGGPYTFTAPVVPVSRTTSSNKVYLAFFYPGEGNFWAGNVIKLGISADGDIVDANGAIATWPNGVIKEEAVPFWATIDWAAPHKSNYIHNSSRKIYTYLGASTDLTDDTNEFNSSNTALTAPILGNPDNHTTEQLIDFVRGADVDGQNRAVITGDVQHSEPLVIDYEDSLRVIYFGANDGMLHAVKDSTLSTPASDDGREMWAFIPPDQLHRLKDMVEGESHQYYVDSSPKVYIRDVNGNGTIEVNVDSDGDDDVDDDDKDQVILVCGERKGGTSYFALDVTNPERPFFLWRISQYDDAKAGSFELENVTRTFEDGEVLTDNGVGAATADGTLVESSIAYREQTGDFAVGGIVTGEKSGATATIVSITCYAPPKAGPDVVIAELGESWSEPRFGLVKTSNEDDDAGTPVFFIGGGYSSDNSVGKAVLAINVFTGGVVKKISNINGMNYSIPSSVTLVDGDSNGFVDKLYVGDLGSQVWRFGKFTDKDDNPLVFPATDENIMNWTDQAAHILFLSDPAHGRKFFYPPSVTLEWGYDLVFMGTGDREDPCNTSSSDRIYSVKDTHAATTLTESDLIDVTESTAMPPDLNIHQGWYIRLAQGEKVLSEGVVFLKTYYLTTFFPGQGGRLYALNYKTGEAVYRSLRVIGEADGLLSKPVVVINKTDQKLLVSASRINPAAGESGSAGPGILAIEPSAPPSNFFYMWWREL